MAKRQPQAARGAWAIAGVLAAAACSSGMQAEAKLSSEAEAPGPETAPRDRGAANTHESVSPAKTPPAAVVDPGPPGTVTFIYQRQRITACGMTTDDEGVKVCSATDHAEHEGKADIVLLPIDEHGDEDPSRAEVVLAFDERPSTQTREQALGKGRWELEWKGESTARDRFQVASSDSFEITLQAIAGMCTLEGKKCNLAPQKNQQVIELPQDRGLD